MNGNAGGILGVGAVEGAELPGRRPRALSAATRGFSGVDAAAGCVVLFPVGIRGMLFAGGGVGCWRAAVALISPANVPGFKSC